MITTPATDRRGTARSQLIRMLAERLVRDALDDEDRDRTRAILADMIGPVTVLHEEGGVFAEIEAPAARLLVAVAGGASLEGVAGARNSVQRLKIRIT